MGEEVGGGGVQDLGIVGGLRFGHFGGQGRGQTRGRQCAGLLLADRS